MNSSGLVDGKSGSHLAHDSYKNVLKDIPVRMAAIEKFNPRYKIFFKFVSIIGENFFKYRGYREVTVSLFNEVVEPFVKSSLVEANVSKNDIAYCTAGANCKREVEDAEIHLIAPIELFKMRHVSTIIYNFYFNFFLFLSALTC